MTDKPGEKPFMTIDSLKIFVSDMGLENCTKEEDFGFFFNLSCQIWVDETKTDFHFKMRNKLEFFEMYARLADNSDFKCNNENVIQPTTPYKDLELGDKLWVLTPNLIGKVFNPNNKADLKTIDDLKNIINKFKVVTVN